MQWIRATAAEIGWTGSWKVIGSADSDIFAVEACFGIRKLVNTYVM